MAFNAFLNIPGLSGESTDDQHEGWMGVLSFSEGLSSTASPVTSGGAAGDVQVQDFSITKFVDTATPGLRGAICGREVFPEVAFEVCQTSGDKHKYLEIKMSDVMVASVRSHGTSTQAEGLPSEEVTLRFSKIEWNYSPMGGTSGMFSVWWDFSRAEG
jgi:type VI secretion system Hcp family effector